MLFLFKKYVLSDFIYLFIGSVCVQVYVLRPEKREGILISYKE